MLRTKQFPGRFCNHFFRNYALSILAPKYQFPIQYSYEPEFAKLGIVFNLGTNLFPRKVATLTDDNFMTFITSPGPVVPCRFNELTLHNCYFQSRDFVLYLADHFDFKKSDAANIYRARFNNNNDVFVHVRLGDATHENPGLEYYEKCLNKITFTAGYIASDSPDHPICRRLKEKYGLRAFNESEVDTIAFGATCHNIILSNGTFSWMIGFLAKPSSDVYFPRMASRWHGDIFVIDDWRAVDV